MIFEKPEARSQKLEVGSPMEGDALDRLIAEGIGRSLDLERGRAGEAFWQSVRKVGAGRRNWRRARWWTGAGLAAAACVAGVVTLEMWNRSGGAGVKVVPGGTPETVAQRDVKPQPEVALQPGDGGGRDMRVTLPLGVPVVDRVDYSRDVDGGTIVMDNVPLKVVRHQTVRQTQWVDPADKASYSVTEPVEKVGYERLMPY